VRRRPHGIGFAFFNLQASNERGESRASGYDQEARGSGPYMEEACVRAIH